MRILPAGICGSGWTRTRRGLRTLTAVSPTAAPAGSNAMRAPPPSKAPAHAQLLEIIGPTSTMNITESPSTTTASMLLNEPPQLLSLIRVSPALGGGGVGLVA